MISKYNNSAVVHIARVFEPVYHIAFQRILLNGTFCSYILPRFSECVISGRNQLWGSYLVWECSKFNSNFENTRKNREKAFCFWDNCVLIGCVELSLLKREYLWSAVNVLANSYKALYLTKTDFFQLNHLQSHHWIWQDCCCSDPNSVWTRFSCCLSKGPFKWDFLHIYITTFFGVRLFGEK